MALSFKHVTLPYTHLAQSMGQTQSEVHSALQAYLDQNAITNFETYTLDMVITQGSKRNVVYLAFASIPDGLKPSGSIKVIPLKRNDFLEFEISDTDYDGFLEGKFNDEVNQYFKANDLKGEMSSVFSLLQRKDTLTRVLLPYKQK